MRGLAGWMRGAPDNDAASRASTADADLVS